MNETFNLRRFGLLFKKTLSEQFLQTFGIMGISILATLVFYRPFDVEKMNMGVQMDTFTPIFSIGTGCITFFMFNYFSENAKGYNFLLLPSSFFEKWLVGFIMTALFFLIYLVFFRIVDTYHVNTLYNEINLPKNISDIYVQNLKRQIQILRLDDFYVHRFLYTTFIGTGIIAVGNLYINKNAFVKICLILVGLLWTFIYLDRYIFQLFFETNSFGKMLGGDVALIHGDRLTMPKSYKDGFDILYQLIFPSALWLIALIRLREKEI